MIVRLIQKKRTVSNNLTYELDKVLGRFHIQINKYIDLKYIQKYFKDQHVEFPLMVYKILNGLNRNEVELVEKIKKNKGFFEKFFYFFN